MNRAFYDIAVIGAGIVGACCALWLQKRGLKVLLIDRDPPASGASYGNACTIANYGCVPINNPALPRQLPGLMFAKDSPLSIDWAYAVRNLPWMISFLRHCSEARVRHITDSLARLLQHSAAGLDPLLDLAAARDLIVCNDCLYVYSSKKGFAAAENSIESRLRNGVDLDVLEPGEIRELEPNLKLPIHKGLRFNGARHVRNPQTLVQRFVDKFVSDGGVWRQDRVMKTEAGADGVSLSLQNGEAIVARKCVVAAGAHSKLIPGTGAQLTPLDTERGYHVQYRQHANLLSRPVGWADAGLYATPTDVGLRFAGTVELAGLKKPANKKRIDYLHRMSHAMLGDLGVPQQDWMGFRPTLPDSLPVIGVSAVSDNILLAYGHHHLGLTLGGITGKIISEIVCGESASIDISAYAPGRFDRPEYP